MEGRPVRLRVLIRVVAWLKRIGWRGSGGAPTKEGGGISRRGPDQQDPKGKGKVMEKIGGEQVHPPTSIRKVAPASFAGSTVGWSRRGRPVEREIMV